VVSVTLNRDLGAGNPGLYQFLQFVYLHLVCHLWFRNARMIPETG
jgi:hypothetical protein